MTAVGIDGLGRIGRLLARRLNKRDDASCWLELVISNLVADIDTFSVLAEVRLYQRPVSVFCRDRDWWTASCRSIHLARPRNVVLEWGLE